MFTSLNIIIVYICNMIERLKLILDYYDLTSSNFAEKIDVPRSSISHLLSGRNKPSLDFILKVDKTFEEVSLEWLLYGKGTFPKSSNKETSSPSLFTELPDNTSKTEEIKSKLTTNEHKVPVNELKRLIKVILLYSDGTFDEFEK
ncbi:helix-turn-helix protein [Tenacibaculum skagerrakense]|uniref:Helix-turn-helix protein n=1 Tax=Tenacibaculum skagerrakense TaxID=186571 RepID=A0A4R2NUY1_9FLAO|nr:helix-turn-helix transcriptional regulator [Tenacibaculum skagerrakense]TCP25800.1 helix-turn-helix protein [Tenacibaculum skagerrakense]